MAFEKSSKHNPTVSDDVSEKSLLNKVLKL